ncbi:VCBS repeat-containing protein [Streptomyces sp. NPDC060064]|uniref:VCBS repeat-containing protein n=1 Tax=Streptomyces sp. NPDC060064 TaxID=3347049 RepID=UPI0036AA05A8
MSVEVDRSVAPKTPDEAAALAEAADSGKPVEVISRRTETSQTFANPTGTFTESRYTLAQWTRQGNKLVDIDTTLAPATDGTVSPKATTVDVTFSGGGTGALATVVRDGRTMSLSWPTALSKPHLDADTATYPEVLPGVDLKLRAVDSGFSQLLVVKSAEAAANPALKAVGFKLATDGLEVSADGHGNLRAVNPAGQEVFTAPTPRMWDSTTAAPVPQAARSVQSLAAGPPPNDEFEPGHGARQAAMPLDVAAHQITLTPDQSLLTGKDTTYPVYIDPAVSGGREAWAIAYKKYPNTSYLNGAGWGGPGETTSTARVGYENETNGLARSFFRMDTNNLWNTKKQVIASTFRIKNTWSWSCTDRTVETWLTNPISSSTTWNSQNNSSMWARKLDQSTESKGWSSSCPAGNLAYDVTSAAKEAATKKWPNMTLGMRASNESDVFAWKKFDAKSAVLSTEYNTLPNTPSNLDTIPSTRNSTGCGNAAPVGKIGNTDVYLTAKVSDPDGGTVKAQFQLWAGEGTASVGILNQTIAATSGTVAKLKVPKATLTQYVPNANGRFSWKVRVQDAKASSDWYPSTSCRFDYDATRPSSLPVIGSSDFPDGSDGWDPEHTGQVRTEGLFKLTNGGITDVKSYEYWTDWDPTVRPAAPKTAGDPTGYAEVRLTPPAAGSQRLYVRSIDGAGNRSDRAAHFFYANSLATPDKPGDLNGDTLADFYGLRPDGELWLYPGQGNGHVGTYTVASNTDFTGASLTHRGDWTTDGFEDLVAAIPGDGGKKTLHVFPNNSLGYACSARDEQADGHSQTCLYDEQELDVYDPANNHWADADQILAIGDVDGPLDTDGNGTIDVEGHTDLLVKEGNLLWLYYGSDTFHLDETRAPVLIGNGSWSNYDLAAPGDTNNNGHIDLLARHKTNGELRLYPGTGPAGEGLGNGTTSSIVGTYWTSANRPLLTAAPDNGTDGKADLWATGSDDKLYAYPDFRGPGTAVGTGGWNNFQSIN